MPLPSSRSSPSSSAVQAIPSPSTSSSSDHPHDRIVLCIGGHILQTSRQTLCVDRDSMLAAWVLRHLNPPGDQMLWIDRDARRFHHVLNYLRNGTIWLDDVASLRAVQEEASFFGLTGLEALCEERIHALRSSEEALRKRRREEVHDAVREALVGIGRDSLLNLRSKGEVVAVLRGRRLGAADAVDSSEPVFQMDEDF